MRVLWVALLGLVVSASVAADEPDPRIALREAMAMELTRSMTRLKMEGFESPYFISYIVRDYDTVEVLAKNGAVFTSARNHARQAYVEVRVGDYQFDNTAGARAAGDFNLASEDLYEPGAELPLDDDPVALRGALWLLTDTRYKAALVALHQKRGVRATHSVEDEGLASFSKAAPTTYLAKAQPLVVDREEWARRVRAASLVMRRHPAMLDSDVRFQATREVRYLVNSEGARLITDRTIWGTHLQAVARADDGLLLEHGRSFYGASEAELPSPDALIAEVEKLAGELEALRKAPTLDPYTGPAILMEEATGVLFHEVIGHRLEGERLSDESEGQTFKGQIGRRILPTFLDIIDDPTRRELSGVSLNGFYEYDDEAVPAQPVTLVERGVLKTYLMSRRPVTGVPASNGHGRAAGAADPMARMGVTIVASHKQVTHAKLKQMLLEEVRRQGKPFGLIIRDITGGNTNTTSFGYQAFKGLPRLVYRVDAKTGAETLVRGVEMVGTPLTSINKIVATSDTSRVFNGYCGAESGFVPVTTVAPAVLLTEIELERSRRTRQKATVLPAPWTDKP
jgi:predicted Zn-dependent protease